MDKLKQTLTSLSSYLNWVDAEPNEWALFGSTSLIVRGVLTREPGDIDLLVSRRVWGEWLAMPELWQVKTPKANDPPILANKTNPIEINAFYDWSNTHVEMNVPKLLYTSEMVGQWRCIPVYDALMHKKWALKGNPLLDKHKVDIPRIEAWLNDATST